jgi:hypothetical protein
MKDFIKINNTRLKKSSIKKYTPVGKDSINIYFSTSRYKVDVETFKCDFREAMLEYLDSIFLL